MSGRDPEPLRLGTNDGGVYLEATATAERATLRASTGTIELTRKGASHLTTWLRAWSRPRERLVLWGHGDIAREFGVSAATVTNWRKRPRFPEPICEPSCGPVWAPDQVRAWVKQDRRKGGRPKKVGGHAKPAA